MIRILVPVDFSDASKKALEYAISLSSHIDLEIHMLHVTTVPTRSGTKLIHKMREAVKEGDRDLINEKSKSFLKTISSTKGLVEECIIRYGDVSKQVINVSLQDDFDLIIMGTKGATWIKERFIGSNTFSTLKLSSVPIIVVPLIYDAQNVKSNACVALRFDKLYSDQCLNLISISQKLGYNPDLLTVVDHKTEGLEIEVKKDGKSFPVSITKNDKPRLAIASYLDENKSGLLALHFNAYSFFKELTYQSVSNEFTFRSKIPILFMR